MRPTGSAPTSPLLQLGPYSLGLLDVATGTVHPVPGSRVRGKSIPSGRPTARSLYFLSDPDGITNVYRVDLASGHISRVTDLFTGVSGITETSPALSVAQRSGRLVYSVFRANGYELYAIDTAQVLAGRPLPAYGPAPPGQRCYHRSTRRNTLLVDLLQNPKLGLPQESEFPVQPYRSGFSLTYVGSPRYSRAATSSAPLSVVAPRSISAMYWGITTW